MIITPFYIFFLVSIEAFVFLCFVDMMCRMPFFCWRNTGYRFWTDINLHGWLQGLLPAVQNHFSGSLPFKEYAHKGRAVMSLSMASWGCYLFVTACNNFQTYLATTLDQTRTLKYCTNNGYVRCEAHGVLYDHLQRHTEGKSKFFVLHLENGICSFRSYLTRYCYWH